MNKTLGPFGLAATLALAACQSQPIDPKASGTVYQGILPCADCAGIKTTLTLYRDQNDRPSRFKLNQQYLGAASDNTGSSDRGVWVIEQADVDGRNYPIYILNPEDPDEQMRFVRNASNAVEMLNAEGRRISSELNYILMQQGSSASEPGENEH